MTTTPADLQYNRALFNAVPVPMVVADPETGEVTDANDAFLDLLGRTREDVIGATHPYPWRTDPADPPAGPGTVIERRYSCPDGRTFPVQIATHDLPGLDERRRLTVAIVTDLSERIRVTRELLRGSKLAAIGELSAGVAHEINNPLLAILGLTEFLLLDAEPGSKQEERLKLIQETGLEIKEIVRALLEFAREHPQERRVIVLGDAVHRTIELVRRTNSQKNVEIVERYEDPGLRVQADGDHLEQLVLNLVANARQAMPEGGVIEVTVRRDGSDALVVVHDEGPGVPPELAERIFDPFFTTRRADGGTGLGLPASLGIAEAHGGTLTVANDPGPGATLTLRLPLDPESA